MAKSSATKDREVSGHSRELCGRNSEIDSESS